METTQPGSPSHRAYRPDAERETPQHTQAGGAGQEGAAMASRELKIEFLCEDRGPNTGPGQAVLRAVDGQIWNGRPDGELRLQILNEVGQKFFIPGTRYTLAFQPVSVPVAAGAGEGEEDEGRSRRSAL